MKYFIFLILIVNLAFAQGANGENSNSARFLNVINTQNPMTYINKDLNADGKTEILQGEKIIELINNEYWVKNTTLTAENGDVFEFGAKLRKNSNPLVRQINVNYGYILSFTGKNDQVEVYIAGENGSYESDPIYISLR